jgi:hypothetical protein
MTLGISDQSVGIICGLLLEAQERQQFALRSGNIPAANRSLLKVRKYADALTGSSQGRDALEGLLTSPSPFVRLRAAHRVCGWNPKLAVPVLGRLIYESLPVDLSSDERTELRASAKHSLFNFFKVPRFDRNDLIEPLRAYGVELPWRDHARWQ